MTTNGVWMWTLYHRTNTGGRGEYAWLQEGYDTRREAELEAVKRTPQGYCAEVGYLWHNEETERTEYDPVRMVWR